MRRAALLSLFTTLAVVLASTGQRRESPRKARLDPYGDPLPPGARQRLGTLRFRVQEGASAVALSPDGKTFAVSEKDRIAFYDAALGKLVRAIPTGDDSQVEELGFLDNGRKLFCIDGSSVHLRDVASGKTLATWSPDDARSLPRLVSFTPDGNRFAVGYIGAVEKVRPVIAYDLDTKKELARVTAVQNSEIWAALSPDARTLATGGRHVAEEAEAEKLSRTVQVWDVATGKERLRFQAAGEGPVSGVFSPDGKWLALEGFKPALQLWNAFTGKLCWQADSDWDRTALAFFSPNGERIYAASTHGDLRIWEVATGKVIGGRGHKAEDLVGVVFRPDGKVRAWNHSRQTLFVWDPLTGAPLTPAGGHTAPIHALGFSSDGQVLCSLDEAGLLCRWQTRTGKRLAEFDLRPYLQQRFRVIQSVGPGGGVIWFYGKAAFAPDCRHLIMPADGLVVVDPADGMMWAAFGREHLRKAEVVQVVFSADGSKLGAFLSPGWHSKERSIPVLIWDTRTRKELNAVMARFPDARPEKLTRFVFGALSADGKRAAVATVAQTTEKPVPTELTSWDLATATKLGTCTLPWDGEVALAFAPDGESVVATGRGNELFVYSVVTGAHLGKIEGPWESITAGPVFGRNGRMLAIATDGKGGPAVRVLEWPSRAERLVFRAPPCGTRALAFSPDDRTLASGHGDTTVLLWDLTGKSGWGPR